ncbi:MAG: glycosyltransferase [Phycisphaerales bacterium]|nr:glycosyltransferase [Phycisphaerales bacterium]
MISFIVPAYNEANQIGAVVASIRDAAADLDHEIIVADDDSTDDTAARARAAGAIVRGVRKRQIAAVRNAGAAAARGAILVFVDGDTFLNRITLRAALAALDRGAAGGGALVRFDDAPRSARIAIAVVARVLRLAGCCGGCFVFVRRDVYDDVGGFDETLFAGEEIVFARAVRRRGRFVVLDEPVTTSGRKARRFSTLTLFGTALRIGLRGRRGVRRREGLEIWYDGEREAPDRIPPPPSPGVDS